MGRSKLGRNKVVTLRIKDTEYENLKMLAEADNRNLNNYIIQKLFYENEQKEKIRRLKEEQKIEN